MAGKYGSGAESWMEMLGKGMQAGAEGYKTDQDAALKKLLQAKQQQFEQGTQDKNLTRAQDIVEQNAGQGRKVNVGLTGTGGVSIAQQEAAPNPRLEMMKERQMADLSKRYQQQNGFTSILQELEAKTNKDGNGGVLSNPNAKLMSTGKVASAAPAWALGLGELTGAVPKGTTDERKSLERLVLEYQKSTAGLRQSDALRNQEKAAMGFLASGDPDLVSKGIRSLAKVHKNALSTIKAGYSPDVVNQVHGSMGDPAAMYQDLYDDNSVQGGGNPPKTAPKGGAGKVPSFEEFKAMKKAGKLGQ